MFPYLAQRTLFLFLLLLSLLTTTNAQPKLHQLRPGETVRLASRTIVSNASQEFILTPPEDLNVTTTILLDWVSDPTPTSTLATATQPDVLFSAALNGRPKLPRVSGRDEDEDRNCTRFDPCFDGVLTDTNAFYTHAIRASLVVTAVNSTDVVHVSVLNFARGRVREDGSGVDGAGLRGTLRVRRVGSGDLVCGGLLEDGRNCVGRGRCQNISGDGRGRCACESGYGGDLCATRLELRPGTESEPVWEGDVVPLRESAVVRVSAGGSRMFRWGVGGGSGRVAVRARVLQGAVWTGNGSWITVNGVGGTGVGMWARAVEGRGEIVSERDAEGRGKVFVNSRAGAGGDGDMDFYETVVVKDVGREATDWRVLLVGNLTAVGIGGTGEVVYSVRLFRCGAKGIPKCPFAEGEGRGISRAVIIAVCVVVGSILIAVVVLCLLRLRVKKTFGSELGSGSGAWDTVNWRAWRGGGGNGGGGGDSGSGDSGDNGGGDNNEGAQKEIPKEGARRTTAENLEVYKLRVKSTSSDMHTVSELSSDKPPDPDSIR